MHYTEITIIGVGLAMDAFAVSVTSGVSIKNMSLNYALIIALFFGVFQGIMPIIGWSGGLLFKDYIDSFAHWFAFAILSIIGIKMIYDSIRVKDEEKSNKPYSLYVLFSLAVATSIDALAVGVTFSCLNYNIWHAAILIGVITFLISFIGTQIGKRAGKHLGEYKVEMAGGVILIGIGIKIVLDRLL